MNRKLYVLLFVALATLFVPTILFGPMSLFCVPTCWTVWQVGSSVIDHAYESAIPFGCYGLAYLAVFYASARFSYHMIQDVEKSRLHLFLQIGSLLPLISCSFARVLTYSSFMDHGGTYNFWEACVQFTQQG